MTRCGARWDEAPEKPRIQHTRQREVIKTADWVLDLGSEGGHKGVVESTPEQVAKEPRSYTGHYFAPLLNGHSAAGGARIKAEGRRLPRIRQREAAE